MTLKPIIFMSIHKKYLDQIKQGIKKFEYRNRYPNSETILIFYETNPIQAVTAIVETGIPENKTNIFGYKKSIPIKKVCILQDIPLKYIQSKFPNFKPPQSYYLLNNKRDLKEFLLYEIKKNEISIEL